MCGRNIRERHDDVDVVHLPHDHFRTAAFHTLCGLCDMSSWVEDTDDPVDCEVCMEILEHCLTLAWVRNVIRSRPRKATLERARISVESEEVPE